MWPLAVSAQQSAVPVVGFLGPRLDASALACCLPYGLGRRGLPRQTECEAGVPLSRWRSGGTAGTCRRLSPARGRGHCRFGAPAALADHPDRVRERCGSGPHGPSVKLRTTRCKRYWFYFAVTELPAKRLALLHELLPTAKRIAVLVNPADPATSEPTVRDTPVAGKALTLDVEVSNANTGAEIDAAFAAWSKRRPDALLVGSYPLFNPERAQLVALAARHAFPTIYFQRDYVEAGGLMSYGPDYAESYR